ncbi:MAG: DUF1572 domain-containing protein [Bacteroidia bacterium]|nr:DUF1572 domain-containing protein [Bacteroidia bacterium]
MTDPSFLPNVIKQFQYYKVLGERTFDQLNDEALFWQYNDQSNSVAIIAKHMAGNMLSRWTDFLKSDGEKDWRNRELEFINNFETRADLYAYWEKGWNCLFDALTPLSIEDLDRVVYIRNMGHTVAEAINRQLAHYAYHVGQIVYIGKMCKDQDWRSLSIPKGSSAEYNSGKFAQGKERIHFSDEFLKDK